MAKMIKTTFRLKRGDASVWATKNPVLDPGEPGFEIDTGKLKIGNGTDAWNDLAYLAGDGGGDQGSSSTNAFIFDIELEIDDKDEEDISATTNVNWNDLVTAYNNKKQIIAKQYYNGGEFELIIFAYCAGIVIENNNISAFVLEGMNPNLETNITSIVMLEEGSVIVQAQAQETGSDNLEDLEKDISDIQLRVSTLEESADEIEYINFRLDSNMNITSAPSESAYSICKKQHNGKQMIAKIWQATGDGEGKMFYIPLIYVKEQEDIYVPYFTFNINNTFYTISAAGSYENYTSSTWTITSFFLPNETAFNTLSSTVSGLESTIANLPRGIRFLGKGEVLPPFEGGEIENGDIYLVGDKEYIAYNETWYELGDYGAYATQSDLNTKVDKVSGKGLSTEDYTTAEKTKLAGIDMTTKANVTDLGDLAYRSLGAVSDSNTTSPPSGAAVKEAIDTATSEVGAFVEDAINQAIIGAMNASY